MAKRKRSPDIDELKKEFMERVNRLENDCHLNLSYISYKIGVNATSFFKYAEGKLPETKPKKIEAMNIKMQELEDEKKLEKLENKEADTSKKSSTKNNPTADDLESTYKINTSLEDIDYETDVLDAAAEPEIRVGSRIGVKKIDIEDCEWGKYHYIFDSLKQPYLRRLYYNGDGTYRLVAETDKYPDLHFEKSKIEVVYKVVYTRYKPK